MPIHVTFVTLFILFFLANISNGLSQLEQEVDIIDSGLSELETNLTMLEIDFVSELNYLCRTFNVVLVSF